MCVGASCEVSGHVANLSMVRRRNVCCKTYKAVDSYELKPASGNNLTVLQIQPKSMLFRLSGLHQVLVIKQSLEPELLRSAILHFDVHVGLGPGTQSDSFT